MVCRPSTCLPQVALINITTSLLTQKNCKPLVKKLLQALARSNHLATICSLTILYSVFKGHEDGSRVSDESTVHVTRYSPGYLFIFGVAQMFKGKQINHTIMLMFNILINDHDVTVRTLVVDLFVHMLQEEHMRQAIAV